MGTIDKKVAKIRKKLTYAATQRCLCGAGMAYGDMTYDEDSSFVKPYNGYWDCSAILDGTADKNIKHEAKLPFSFYEINSENQPSARGDTTRPQ